MTAPPSPDVFRDVGENVFLNDVPDGYKVFAFYYPSAMKDQDLEDALRGFGELTGSNLLMNMGKLNDPAFNRIVKAFEIDHFPTIVMTATVDLAGSREDSVTAFVRIDNGRLLSDPARLIALLQELYVLFLRGEIADAVSKASRKQRFEIVRAVASAIGNALKKLAGFVADRDIKVSLVDGSFELVKHSQ